MATFDYDTSPTINLSGTSPVATSWLMPAFYHGAVGGLSLSAYYEPTHEPSGGMTPTGTALVATTYSYIVKSGFTVGGVGFAKLVTPARTKHRATMIENQIDTKGGVPGHCLVYSRGSVLSGDKMHKAAAWLPKHLLNGKTVVEARNVKDRRGLDPATVVAEAC